MQDGRRGEAQEAAAEVEWMIPLSHVVGKNQEGYLDWKIESERSQAQARQHSPGFQLQEDKSP